jgi:hypothetical protein
MIASMLCGDVNSSRLNSLCQDLGLSLRLVKSWRKWWNNIYSNSKIWLSLKDKVAFSQSPSFPDIFFNSFESLGEPENQVIAVLKLIKFNII